MKRRIKVLTALSHQLLGKSQPPVSAHHTQAGDVAMLNAISGVLLHLGEHITDDLRRIVGALGWARDLNITSAADSLDG